MIEATGYDGPPRVELVWDEAQPGQAEQVLRTNLVTNPQPESATGWAATGGNTLAAAPWDAGRKMCQATANGTGTPSVIAPAITVTSGQKVPWRIKVWAKTSDYQLRVAVRVGTSGGTYEAGMTDWTAPEGGGWAELSGEVTATSAGQRQLVVLGVGIPLAGWQFGAGDIIYDAGPYFDGSSATSGGKSHRWVGAINASASEEYIPMVPPGDPWPAGSTMTITRTANQLSGTVRGATNRAATVTGFIVDWEAPVGVPIVYTLEAWSPAGVRLADTSVTVDPLPEPSGSSIWLSDPLVEGSAIEVTALQGTDAERKYPQEVSRVYPAGQRYGAASVTQRRGIDEWPLVLFAKSAEYALALRTMIMTAASLCVRVPAWHQLDPIMYGQFDGTETFSPRRADIVATWSGNLLTSGGPGLDVVVASRTYDDVLAEHETYVDIITTYDSYTDLQRGQV